VESGWGTNKVGRGGVKTFATFKNCQKRWGEKSEGPHTGLKLVSKEYLRKVGQKSGDQKNGHVGGEEEIPETYQGVDVSEEWAWESEIC